jgi:hypothetical protein
MGEAIKLLDFNIRENMDLSLIKDNKFQVRANQHKLLDEIIKPVMELFESQIEALNISLTL